MTHQPNFKVPRSDPFFITGPALISFSGGPTSGHLLWRILQAHGGTLPDDVVVAFANTGEESEITLEFVRDCGDRWDVPIIWLEFRHGYKEGATRRTRWAEVVRFETASRKGEPFDMLLESKKIVPDRSRRSCTEQLKVWTITRYLRALGWKKWQNVIGYRADESVRIETKIASEAAKPWAAYTTFPLAAAGVQEFEILLWWKQQNFRLRRDPDGEGHNCGGMCFMMSSDQIGRMSQSDPERAGRWAAREARWGTKTMRPDASYASIFAIAKNQGVLPWDDAAPCNHGCGI
jgi:3'-phosphoadenosine 5'-phosphosulfate sulfotransferase (PAPS reductase)/FAD synthetase